MPVVSCFSEHPDFVFEEMLCGLIELMVSKMRDDFAVKDMELSVVVMDSVSHTEMNSRYLGHDYPTDILTFDLSTDELFAGDVYINYEVMIENAREYGVTNAQELLRLVAHGMLHLLGFDDHAPEDRLVMGQKEDVYLALIDFKGFM